MRNTEHVVVMITKKLITIVQTEDTDLLKCKECEHSENLKDSWRNFHIETDLDKRLWIKGWVGKIG